MISKKIVYSIVCITSLIVISGCNDKNQASTEQTPSQNVKPSSEKVVQEAKKESELTTKYEQGVNLYNQGKLDEALAIFKECLAKDSTNGSYEYYIGNILRKNNDFQNALVNYKNAIEKSPDLIEAYNNSAAIQMATQSFDEALETVNKGLIQKPDFADLQFKKAQILYVKQQFKESIALLAPLAEDPAYFEASRFLGLSYINLNDKTKALEHFNIYLKQAPEGIPFKETVKQMVAELEKSK
ncbi:tetratricopeptide repeat protein [Brevibacillus brevis]|uniref:Tetratricopeptide repeat protein n=1 Tax=Brevibacillus brevis TaxID=1393 RepID=A0A2Z4MQ31_BREBE|nr:tetratricopeptide repeat protein [Brevibacillus brevis]AWX58618.1 tetratricopeptide repeat protein [Brevibacillus brevis]